jgi:hypothetical protein
MPRNKMRQNLELQGGSGQHYWSRFFWMRFFGDAPIRHPELQNFLTGTQCVGLRHFAHSESRLLLF